MPYSEYDIEEWKSNGVKRVLVLAEDWEIEEAWGDRDYYFSILKNKGLEVLHEPIPNGYPPTLEQFKEIIRWLLKDHGNLVHCVGGIGRTGTIIAGYLMVTENFDAFSAIEEVRSYRPGAIETYEQEMFLIRLWSMVKGNWKSIL